MAVRQGFPIAVAGMRVGLLGGSFDPAHGGHAHLTREALKRLGLDRIWWLVSPGNPLKPNVPAPLEQRMAMARRVMDDPRVIVSDVEARLGTHYTAETLAALRAIYPGVRFVWLMGADNLAQFHRWQNWDQIICSVPIAVFARPGTRLEGRGSRAAEEYSRYRLPAEAARGLAARAAPAWVFLDMPLNDISSSAIRAAGKWRSTR